MSIDIKLSGFVMLKLKRYILCLLGLIVFVPIFAQSKGKYQLRGRVVDGDKHYLPGVHIALKNGTKTIFSDAQGIFTLYVDSLPVDLSFTYIGMKQQSVRCQGEKFITVHMQELTQNLKDVVVTGFRAIDKRRLSSAITSMSMSDLHLPSTTSLDQMLQGRVAGISVIGSGATVGTSPKIRIRGSSSITGSREPIWVVDGFVLDEVVAVSPEELNNVDNVNFVGNAISGISPDDIERIDILKDASATALYGTKAANGVVVVTTKQGRDDRPTVNYRANFGLNLPPTYNIINQMNSKERIEVSEEMHHRGLQFFSYLPSSMAYEGALHRLWDKEIDYDEFREQVRQLKELNTDWFSLLFRDAFRQQHALSLSGRTSRLAYYTSVSYLDEQGLNFQEYNRRFTAMAKIQAQLSSKLDVRLKISSYSGDKRYTHPSLSLLEYAYNTARTIPVHHTDGSLFYYDRDKTRFANLPFNVLNELKHTGRELEQGGVDFNVEFVYRPLSWLKIQSLSGIAYANFKEERWADERSFYISQKRLTPYGIDYSQNEEFREHSALPLGGELYHETSKSARYSSRNTLELNHSFARQHFYALLGWELNSSTPSSYKVTNYGYMPNRGKSFAEVDLSDYKTYARLRQNTQAQIREHRNNTLSAFSALTYTYDNRYIANFNLRTDGSNRFGQDRSVRFLPIWSISARWNISNEAFAKKLDYLDNLSLRVSRGIQGHVHSEQTPYLIVRRGSYNSLLNSFTSTLAQYPNHHLRWERTLSYNLGLDMSLFNSRFSLTMDTYHKKGHDQIVRVHIAPSNGAKQAVINSGDIENYGWELALGIIPIQTKDWLWSVSFNTGRNYNKVKNEGDYEASWQDYISGRVIKNGHAVNSLYAYRFRGLNPENGRPIFYGEREQDDKGITIINSQEEAFRSAFVYVGKKEPELSGGFSSTLRYKNFTLNTLFAFALGHKIRLNPLYANQAFGLPFPQQNMSKEFARRWQNPGDEQRTNIPALSDESLAFAPYERKYPIADNRWTMYDNSDIRIASGDFLRCRSLSLRYDLTKSLLKVLHIRGASITLEAGNLFVLKSSDLVGRDPEQLALGSGSIPPSPNFNCQLSLTL